MTLIVAVVALYALICALAFVFQGRLVFFPDGRLLATPKAIGLDYEDVHVNAAPDVRLHGWFVPAAGDEVLLFFHGNAGNISHRLESIQIFHRLGLAVLIVDYRGYGESTGRISEAGSYEDARAAFDYLTREKGYAPGQIVIFGRSLGSAVAIELATQVHPRALIAESSYTSLPDVGARHYRFLPVRLLSRIRFDSTSRVGNVTCPKLFIHSRDDETLPYDLAQRLYQEAAEPKEFLTIRGDHNSGFITSGADYIDGLRGFLASLD